MLATAVALLDRPWTAPLNLAVGNPGNHRQQGGPHEPVPQGQQGAAHHHPHRLGLGEEEKAGGQDGGAQNHQQSVRQPPGHGPQDRTLHHHHHRPQAGEEGSDLGELPLQRRGGMDGEGDIEEVERQEDQELHGQKQGHAGESGHLHQRRRLRGAQSVTLLLLLAHYRAHGGLLRTGRQRARIRFGQPEGDEKGGHGRDQKRGQDRNGLARGRGSQQSGQSRSQDEPQVRRHRHLAEVRAAVGLAADVGQVRVGHRYVAAGQPVQRPATGTGPPGARSRQRRPEHPSPLPPGSGPAATTPPERCPRSTACPAG